MCDQQCTGCNCTEIVQTTRVLPGSLKRAKIAEIDLGLLLFGRVEISRTIPPGETCPICEVAGEHVHIGNIL